MKFVKKITTELDESSPEVKKKVKNDNPFKKAKKKAESSSSDLNDEIQLKIEPNHQNIQALQNKLNELKPGETYKDKAQILYDLNDTQEKNDRHHETKKINVINYNELELLTYSNSRIIVTLYFNPVPYKSMLLVMY